MRILVAPDCFTGTLTASRAADAMAEGWRRGAPHDSVTALPLADGGPGFCEAVQRGVGGELVPVTVTDPLGGTTPAAVLLVDGPAGRVAYLESAHAVGPHLVPAGRRDPGRATTVGVGELLRTALDLGAVRIVVGLGDSVTDDAGAGMLAGLGADAPVLRGGGAALSSVTAQELGSLPALRRELAGVDLVVATDVDIPLLGLHGASAGLAAQGGAGAEQSQQLERALGHFAHVAATVVASDGLRRDLLAPSPVSDVGTHLTGGADTGEVREVYRGLTQRPGAGAAGGLGFGLALLGGRVLSGAQVVAEAVGLPQRAAEADLVLTGEPGLDWRSLHGSVVATVAAEGLARGVPVVAVAGEVTIGRREWGAAGFAGVYAVVERPQDRARHDADPATGLAARVERVARTWSPRPPQTGA